MSYDRKIVDQFVADIRVQHHAFVVSFWSKISTDFNGDVLDQNLVEKLLKFNSFCEWTKANIMDALAEDIYRIAQDTARRFVVNARRQEGHSNIEHSYFTPLIAAKGAA